MVEVASHLMWQPHLESSNNKHALHDHCDQALDIGLQMLVKSNQTPTSQSPADRYSARRRTGTLGGHHRHRNQVGRGNHAVQLPMNLAYGTAVCNTSTATANCPKPKICIDAVRMPGGGSLSRVRLSEL